MGITADQRIQRRKYIGSSDSPAILGVDTFKTAADVYWSKIAALDERDKPAFELGRRLEVVILDWCADKLGVPIKRNHFIAQGNLCANLDGITDGNEVVEAKYSSQFMEWGDESTDQIPERVIVQVQHQMALAKAKRAYVPALIITPRGAEFRLYVSDADVQLGAMIVERGERFWADHVMTKTPPPDGMVPSIEILRALRREPETCVDLDDAVLNSLLELEAVSARRKAAEKEEESLRAQVIASLQEAEAGRLPDGRLVTFLQQRTARRCDFDALRRDYPEIYDRLVTQGSTRVMRIKVPKTVANLAA